MKKRATEAGYNSVTGYMRSKEYRELAERSAVHFDRDLPPPSYVPRHYAGVVGGPLGRDPTGRKIIVGKKTHYEPENASSTPKKESLPSSKFEKFRKAVGDIGTAGILAIDAGAKGFDAGVASVSSPFDKPMSGNIDMDFFDIGPRHSEPNKKHRRHKK